jgi:hypothetical protein
VFDVFFFRFRVQPRQRFPRRRLDPRRLGETRQKFLIALPRVAADDAPHRGVGLDRGRVDCHRLPLERPCLDQELLDPREHGATGLEALDRGVRDIVE